MKKLIALILALILIFSVSPLAFAASGSAAERDIWDTILEIEENAANNARANSTSTRELAYADAVDQIAEAVTSYSKYVPGSLIRNGDHLFWDETDGTGCGYSPRLRARIRESVDPNADPEEYAGIVTSSYAEKGGSPGSTSVAAFQPYIGIDSSFSAQYEQRCNSIAQALGGTGTTYKTTNATIDNIANALQTCAVVIFDSHGDTDYSGYGGDYTSRANTSYICLQSGAGFTDADQQTVQGPYSTYKHAYYGGSYGNMYYYMADGTAISNHMTGTSPNGLLWMAICLGMATDGLHLPLRNRGLEVAYGYSQSVTFAGDYAWEGKFWPKMIEGSEVQEAIAYEKQQVGCPDPYTSNYPAYPIVVSSEDVYPGHGNVDAQQTVHSTWTLYSQYEITALSNNDDWGTVSVSGRQITAYPKTGYQVVGYDIVSGDCSVTRNGNVFQVDAESDCTIRINFAARVPATVNFVVPEGVSVDNYSGYVGDELPFPTPVGEPNADAFHYSFLGWTTAELADDTQEMPIFQKAGTQFTVATPQSTYYALYKYFVAEDGVSEGAFKLVTAAPASWTGDYVITYQGTRILDASGEITGSSIGGSAAAKYLEDAGATLDGDALYNVPDDYIYTAEPAGNGGYTLKMKNHDIYLALTSDSNALMTATSGANKKAQWLLSLNAQGVQIANAMYPERTIRFNNANKGLFRCYKSGQEQISVYSAGNGTTWFTTNPKYKTVCDQHSFGDWTQTKAPSCTEPGSEKRVCTVCGYAETRELPALGHDYNAVVTNPTCTEQGFTTYTCSRCGDSYVDNYVDALGHAFSEWTETTAPSCTEPGEESRLCARCLTTETRPVDALGHDYGEWIETTAPGCTEPGEETSTCSRCGGTLTRPVEALGHDYGEWIETTAPGCTEPGEEISTCSRCGEMETRPVEALGHDYQAVVTAPSCTEQGFTTYTCSRCGDSYVDNYVDALGHAFSEWTETTAPSCTEPGEESRLCARCLTTETRPVDALGHDFGDWTVTTAPTCTEAGTETRSCSRCDEMETRPVDALGHTPAEPVKENETAPSCTEPGGFDMVTKCSVCGVELSREHIEIPATGHTPAEPVKENETAPSCTEPGGCDMVTKCSVCGFELSREHIEIPALGHAWDEGTVTVEPTESTPGVRTFTCTVCGATREEEIPVLDHDCKISQFVDVEAYPYGTTEHAAIEWAFTHTPQITAGTDGTHFSPEMQLNRATAMTFLWAAAGKPNPKSTTSPFSDVKMGKWYTKAILWAAENKITSGNTDGTFGINTVCNRGHILTFLYAQQGKPGYSIENPYSDVGNKWYTHAAIWAYEKGIEKGEDGKFNYKTPCTRILAVTYIYRALTGKGLAE